MGKIYQGIARYLPAIPEGVFVEIGSERGEGSSVLLNQLACQYNTRLISVDINANAKQRYQHELTHTEFVVAAGSIWAQEFATKRISIALLYLDNFDYIWDVNNISAEIGQQVHQYAEQGMTMTNQHCQLEHMKQIVALRSCLASNGLIVFDDTYRYNDCWIGKCGPAVVYLQAYGWSVVAESLDCGVVMKKLDNV